MNRIDLCFSNISNDMMNIFKSEVLKLLPELNKKYNIEIHESDIVFESIIRLRYSSDGIYSAFYPENNKYHLILYPEYCIMIYNQSDSRPHKIYKSLELFIKDCACHELFHLYDFAIHSNQFKTKPDPKSLNHDKWWIKNYKDYRKEYTDSDPIIEMSDNGLDYAYFSKNKYFIGFKSDKYYLRDRKPIKVDKSNISYLLNGGYLDYINSKINWTNNYDIIVGKVIGAPFEIKPLIDNSNHMFLIINHEVINKFIETSDIRYIDALIYSIEFGITGSIDNIFTDYLATL